MRIHVVHETAYEYTSPAASAIEILRLTPRNHDGQYIVRWRVELNHDCKLDPFEDAFGNLAHTFTVDGPVNKLIIRVAGEVETQDTNGVVRGTIERFPPSLYLRETPLTRPDSTIRQFAEDAAEKQHGDPLATMHELTARIYSGFTFDPDAQKPAMSAARCMSERRGVCQDYAQVLVASARHLKIPARYISGYFHRADGITAQEAGHAWAEAHLPELGWVGFDPANGISATAAHIRVAAALDSLGAAPVRGLRFGGDGETLSVAVHVAQSERQSQN
ncbi:MAG TPA: transglutaminase family protein [Xanthobacteraceae bacterium]|jgi:transglutaminase-like putative cysteine protease|nr:transglutaminase family protein [Xanthobacteraceae bacterium]